MAPPISMTAEAPALSHEQLIDRIRTFNPTATPEFLGAFDGPRLAAYLEHLMSVMEPEAPRAPWIRRGDSRAIARRIMDDA